MTELCDTTLSQQTAVPGPAFLLELFTPDNVQLTPPSGSFRNNVSVRTENIIALMPLDHPDAREQELLYVDQPRNNADPGFASIVSRINILAESIPPEFKSQFTATRLAHADKEKTTSPDYLYVIVSTRSGQGYAEDMWESALAGLQLGERLVGKPLVSLTDLAHLQGLTDQDVTHSTIDQDQVASASFSNEIVNAQGILHVTTSAASVVRLTETLIAPRARSGYCQQVILLSGDGGVADLLNGLAGTLKTAPARKGTDSDRQVVWADPSDFPLRKEKSLIPPVGFRAPEVSLLPLGTGNALANSAWAKSKNGRKQIQDYDADPAPGKSFGEFLNDVTKGLSSLLRGRPVETPVCDVIFPGSASLVDWTSDQTEPDQKASSTSSPRRLLAAVVCSWGIHASLVANSDRPEYRAHGAARFQIVAKELLFPEPAGEATDPPPPATYHGTLHTTAPRASIRDTPVRSEHMYTLASLCPFLERGFLISPGSLDPAAESPLHVLSFGPMSGARCMEILMSAYRRGAHLKAAEVEYRPADSFAVDFGKGEEDEREGKGQGEGGNEVVCVDGRIVNVPVAGNGWVECRVQEGGAGAWIRLVELQ